MIGAPEGPPSPEVNAPRLIFEISILLVHGDTAVVVEVGRDELLASSRELLGEGCFWNAAAIERIDIFDAEYVLRIPTAIKFLKLS